MQFSAYQIESMLDDYQQENFPSDRSASETLSLSEEAINEARQHITPPVSQASIWKTPKEVIQEGSFGGTYFRPIYSSITKKNYTSKEVIQEYPKSWFKGIDIDKMVTSSKYDKNVNKYKVKCGSSLDM